MRTVMLVPESAVILPPTVGRVPGGGWLFGVGEVVVPDDVGAAEPLVAPATPAPSPSTAAMVPPATAARPGVDQRQRARPRGWGRCAGRDCLLVVGCGLHARAPVRVQQRRSAVPAHCAARRVAAPRVAWGREQNRGGWRDRPSPALGWVGGARAAARHTSRTTAEQQGGSDDTDCARRELGHRLRRHGPAAIWPIPSASGTSCAPPAPSRTPTGARAAGCPFATTTSPPSPTTSSTSARSRWR